VPFFLFGGLLSMAAVFAVALAPSLAALVVAFMAFEFATNSAQAPWQALLPDRVPRARRGAASGLKTVFEILAFVIGRRASGYLIAEERITASAALAAVVIGLSMLLTVLASVEERAGSTGQAAVPDPAAPAGNPVWPPGFGWWFLNRGLFWAGLIALSSFVLFYLEDVVGMSFVEASRFFGDLSLVLGLSLLAVALPAGRLSDRIGRRPLILASCVVAILGNAVLLTARSRPTLTLGGGLLGLAAGTYLAANWALATDLVPRSAAARYLGIANVATAGGSFLARFAGGALIDPVNRAVGSSSAGYFVLYGLTLFGFLIATFAVLRLPRAAFFAAPADP
jgi:MFS family permease